MIQIVDGLPVFIVDLKELPKRPIHSNDFPDFAIYAYVLEAALAEKIITEPGKYGLWISTDNVTWKVYKIQE